MGGDKLHILINREPLTSYRTKNISNARNMYLDKMRELVNTGYDAKYFIAIDMDNVCSGQMDLDVFKRAMGREDQWDSVSFNRHGYYDIWALRHEFWQPGDCWRQLDFFKRFVKFALEGKKSRCEDV